MFSIFLSKCFFPISINQAILVRLKQIVSSQQLTKVQTKLLTNERHFMYNGSRAQLVHRNQSKKSGSGVRSSFDITFLNIHSYSTDQLRIDRW